MPCLRFTLFVLAAIGGFGSASSQSLPAFYRADYPIPNIGGDLAGLVLADINGDGHPDVVFSSQSSLDIYVMLGNGDGTLQAPNTITIEGCGADLEPIHEILAGDFNSDGRADLVVSDGNSLCLLLNAGDGAFASGQTIMTGLGGSFSPNALAVGDFNGDGKLDIVAVVDASSDVPSNVTVLLGRGDGTFSSLNVFNLPSFVGAVSLATGDFNGDGLLDFVVATSSLTFQSEPTDVYVALGKGNGSFSSPIATAAGTFGGNLLLAGDFNGDGKTDIVIQLLTVNPSIMLSNGDGTFRFSSDAPETIGGAVAVDLNGDGTPDLAVSYLDLEVATGVGDGTFLSPIMIAPTYGGQGLFAIVAGDVNGDGKPDLVALNGNQQGMEVYLNATSKNFTVVSAATGGSAMAAESIASLYGANLSSGTETAPMLPLPTTLAGTTIAVTDSAGASRPASLYYVSPQQINFEIPPGTAAGVATLQVNTGSAQLSGTAPIQRVAPSIFTFASNIAAAYTITYGPDGQPQPPVPVATCTPIGCTPTPIPRPAGSRVFLVLFGTGIRNATAVTCSGDDGSTFPVAFAGPQGVDEGLDQVNVEITAIPHSPGAGETLDRLYIVADAWVSNTVNILLM